MLMQQLDTVYVGALTTLVLQVAYLTPPIGLGLFYLKLMFRDISFKDIAMSAIPMMVIQITSIAIYVIYALYMSNRL
jgi:TRAP-type mannitol/chloroaromatic compound transport system permease large subunit